jgi:hypothetical protein
MAHKVRGLYSRKLVRQFNETGKKLMRRNPACPERREIDDTQAMTVPSSRGFELRKATANTALYRFFIMENPDSIFHRHVAPGKGNLAFKIS